MARHEEDREQAGLLGFRESVSMDLVQRIRQGDRAAWSELYERYHDQLLLVVRMRLGPSLRRFLESEDIFQSVALEAFEALESFEYRGQGSLEAYLRTLVVNKIRDRADTFAAEKRAGAVALDAADALPASEPAYHDAERYERLERALNALPLHRRRIEGTNSVVLPWLDGDLERARAALAVFFEDEPDPPFAEFLAGLASDDLEREASDPATRALLEGERARRAGRAREAWGRFNTAWDIAPGYPMVVLLQGLAASEAGELRAARGAFEVAVGSFGRSPRLHRELAQLYEGLELDLDAARALQAVLALTPSDPRAWLALARARGRLGEEAAALTAALRALELAPGEMRAPLEALALDWERQGALAAPAGELKSALARR